MPIALPAALTAPWLGKAAMFVGSNLAGAGLFLGLDALLSGSPEAQGAVGQEFLEGVTPRLGAHESGRMQDLALQDRMLTDSLLKLSEARYQDLVDRQARQGHLEWELRDFLSQGPISRSAVTKRQTLADMIQMATRPQRG